jgi:hypothetical protein
MPGVVLFPQNIFKSTYTGVGLRQLEKFVVLIFFKLMLTSHWGLD